MKKQRKVMKNITKWKWQREMKYNEEEWIKINENNEKTKKNEKEWQNKNGKQWEKWKATKKEKIMATIEDNEKQWVTMTCNDKMKNNENTKTIKSNQKINGKTVKQWKQRRMEKRQ